MIQQDTREPAEVVSSGTAWTGLIGESLRGVVGRKRVLVLGTGQLAKDLCRTLLARGGRSCQIVGFLDRDQLRVGERLVNPSIIGTVEQLFEVVERERVGTIAVCLEDRRGGLPVHTLLDLKAMGVEIVDGHDLYERESGRMCIDSVKPSILVFSDGFRRYRMVMAMKRVIDVVVSGVGLLVLSPVFLVLAGLIRADSRGPAVYQQVRIGYHGRPFVLWKLRSMRCDAEVEGVRWASNNDPRVTRVGQWLRKWRLDELPQLLNVVKGEMSLVGPRPERPCFVEELRRSIPYYDVRHTVRPGITGWAQVRFQYAGSEEETHEKLQYDLYYVKNLSMMLDLKILLKTVQVMMYGKGAR